MAVPDRLLAPSVSRVYTGHSAATGAIRDRWRRLVALARADPRRSGAGAGDRRPAPRRARCSRRGRPARIVQPAPRARTCAVDPREADALLLVAPSPRSAPHQRSITSPGRRSCLAEGRGRGSREARRRGRRATTGGDRRRALPGRGRDSSAARDAVPLHYGPRARSRRQSRPRSPARLLTAMPALEVVGRSGRRASTTGIAPPPLRFGVIECHARRADQGPTDWAAIQARYPRPPQGSSDPPLVAAMRRCHRVHGSDGEPPRVRSRSARSPATSRARQIAYGRGL